MAFVMSRSSKRRESSGKLLIDAYTHILLAWIRILTSLISVTLIKMHIQAIASLVNFRQLVSLRV